LRRHGSVTIRLGAFFFCSLFVTAAAHTATQSTIVRQMTDGREVFRSYCAACHGEDGRGHGPAATALKIRPADLTLIAMRNSGAFPRDRIVRRLTNGDPSTPAHGSKEMPVWGPNLMALAPTSDQSVNERIEAVVMYLRSIQMEK
jgi:mono/diheme cytochrome c family protein